MNSYFSPNIVDTAGWDRAMTMKVAGMTRREAYLTEY